MAEQLILSIENLTGGRPPRDPDADEWRIDEHTREVGRRGLAQARRALAESTRRRDAAGSQEHRRAAAA